MSAPRGALRVNGRLSIPLSEVQITAARSGGPGGQRVNKASTKVVLRFSIPESQVLGEARKARLLQRLASRLTGNGELVLHCDAHRERARNLEDAYERLAETLREGLRVPRARKDTRPTRGSVERRLKEKKRRGEAKRRRRSLDD